MPYYADGSYKVTVQDFDLSGYKEYIVLKVSGGVPTVEEFDAVDEEGKLRSEDTEINPQGALFRVGTGPDGLLQQRRDGGGH